ncbi:DUF790 family protein [Candidatus Poribacteria bacterium]|nr:DUF790 family protein [Candidatus Poribacteria bacterium]MBT7100246.1 DUF790 family protein [Candidatus Poribacteria bacterium]MBT7803922.1 DUF790 family protein [Candidatus Poribacteria bacterium]
MLTTDLVRVRRRAGRITVPPLREAERGRLLAAAEQYVALASDHVGRSRSEYDAACRDVEHDPTDYKLVKGLRKLVEDRCDFAPRVDVEPLMLREAVFTRAAEHRRVLPDTGVFDGEAVVAEVAGDLGMAADVVSDGLYADLKENHILTEFDAITGEALVARYEMAQKQAVLLRAVKVSVVLRCADASGYRLFFRRLKFRRLLYTVAEGADGGYRIDIDGPFSLFKAVTKYGLQLALLLPVLEESGQWELEADILWGPDREPLTLRLEGAVSGSPAAAAARLPDEVEKLRSQVEALDSAWSVAPARELLDLPGVGLCVPDLLFTHATTRRTAHLEVMGYWSRDAVWRRVELVEAGLPHRIIFAVSSRLRVSEDALGEDLPGQLYVYKGVMNAKAILERLDAIALGDDPAVDKGT